jgi:hypothetical protein
MATNSLAWLADRAAGDPFFLAHATRGLTPEALAELLGCDVATTIKVRLCGMPDDMAGVRQIAERFGLVAAALARLCRVQ